MNSRKSGPKKYAREVQSWEKDLDVLLTFMKYPLSIRSVIYTTNAIERTIKDIRKRLKTMNSLTSIAAEKITYLTIQDFNKNGRIENYEVLQTPIKPYKKCSKKDTKICKYVRIYERTSRRLNIQSPSGNR
jgi:transposase-like protein